MSTQSPYDPSLKQNYNQQTIANSNKNNNRKPKHHKHHQICNVLNAQTSNFHNKQWQHQCWKGKSSLFGHKQQKTIYTDNRQTHKTPATISTIPTVTDRQTPNPYSYGAPTWPLYQFHVPSRWRAFVTHFTATHSLFSYICVPVHVHFHIGPTQARV